MATAKSTVKRVAKREPVASVQKPRTRTLSVVPPAKMPTKTTKTTSRTAAPKANAPSPRRKDRPAPATAALASVPAGLTVSLAISTEQGVFLMGATTIDQSPITAMGTVEVKPARRIIPLSTPEQGGILRTDPVPVATGTGGERIRRYVAYLPTAVPLAEQVHQFGVVFASRAKSVFAVPVQPYTLLTPALVQKACQQFSPWLEEVMAATLAQSHPLQLAAARLPRPAGDAHAVTASSDVFGYLDAAADDQAQGWAHDRTNLNRRVIVEVFDGERVVGRGVADQFRDDLLKANIGDGKYKFSIPLSRELRDGAPHQLVARAVGSTAVLKGSPQEYKANPVDDAKVDPIDYTSLEKIVANLTKAAKASPGAGLAFGREIMKANLLLETGAFDEAVSAFTALAKRYGNVALFHCKIGEAHLFADRPPQAKDAYRRALSADQTFAPAHLGLGNCLARQDEWIAAEDAYKDVPPISSETGRAQRRLREAAGPAALQRAELLLQAGDADGAIDIFKTQLLRNPDDRRIVARLAHALTLKNSVRSKQQQASKAAKEHALNKLVFDLILGEAENFLKRSAK